jgi:hypothetical protein
MNSEEKEIESLEEKLSAIKALTTSAGWDVIKEVLVSQIEVRRNLEDAHEIEDFFKDTLDLARLKAERRAFMMVIELPGTIIEGLEEDLEQLYRGDPDGSIED